MSFLRCCDVGIWTIFVGIHEDHSFCVALRIFPNNSIVGTSARVIVVIPTRTQRSPPLAG
jgi:hypothetical protein